MKHRALLGSVGFSLVVACGGSTKEPETATPAATSVAASESDTGASSPSAPSASAGPAEAPEARKEPRTMTIDLVPRSGSRLKGKLTLTEQDGGVKLVLAIEGVSPGDHGAHVHETPDCSAPDAKSAGSHYNPDQHAHGLPSAKERHLGDLGNILVGKDGKGTLEITIPDANLKPGDPHSFIGRSIIVHEKKDDGGQPVGNAGGRIGCAAIQ